MHIVETPVEAFDENAQKNDVQKWFNQNRCLPLPIFSVSPPSSKTLNIKKRKKMVARRNDLMQAKVEKPKKNPNIILISLDAVRYDHLSCYGYNRIKTPNIDKIAEEGVKFTEAITSSWFTPIAMSSCLAGAYPSKVGLRNENCRIRTKLLPSVLQENGYYTVGFVGIWLLSAKHGFVRGFNEYFESTPERAWGTMEGHPDFGGASNFAGYWWIDDVEKWLDANAKKKSPFFLWGHSFDTHEGAEYFMLEKDFIQEGHLPEYSYYDAKIEVVDKEIVGRIVAKLDELDLLDNTLLIVMGDHGEALGEHNRNPEVFWAKKGDSSTAGRRGKWPTHNNGTDEDIRPALIMRGPGLPSRKTVNGQVRTIDIVPTIVDYLNIDPSAFPHKFDGETLLPCIDSGLAEKRLAYAEDLSEVRAYGSQQAVRTEEYKYIRCLRDMTQEFYRLFHDPKEKENVFDIPPNSIKSFTRWERKLIDEWRTMMDLQLYLGVGASEDLKSPELMERLEMLGYAAEIEKV